MAPQQQRNGAKVLCLGAAGAALLYKNSAFVPAPKSAAPVAVGVGSALALGAAPAFADSIGDASLKLTDAAYPFVKDVDWLSNVYMKNPSGASALDWLKAVDKAIVMGEQMDSKLLSDATAAHHKAITTIDEKGVLSKNALTEVDAAIGRLIASVPESTTLDVYSAFKGLTGDAAANYMMSKVDSAHALAAQAGLMEFKDVVKANPITPTEPVLNSKLSAAKLEGVAAAAAKLSSASYPFMQKVDWLSPVFANPLPGVPTKEALKAVDKMIVMGASMDGKLLKEAAEAHHKAIAGIDAKGVLSAADYAAVNAGIGKLIASVPAWQAMDVYTSFARILGNQGGQVGANMIKASAPDAIASYQAFLEFKDVVKAAQLN